MKEQANKTESNEPQSEGMSIQPETLNPQEIATGTIEKIMNRRERFRSGTDVLFQNAMKESGLNEDTARGIFSSEGFDTRVGALNERAKEASHQATTDIFESMDRRTFLGVTMKLAGGMFASMLAPTGAESNQPSTGIERPQDFGERKERREQGESVYVQGIRERYNEVLNDNKERVYFYRKFTSGREEWIHLADSEEGEGNIDFPLIPPDDVEAFLERIVTGEAPVEWKFVHTHPLKVLEWHAGTPHLPNYPNRKASEKAVEKVKRGEEFPPSFPPSLNDILTAQEMTVEGAQFVHEVVDPSGVWEYSVDRKNPNSALLKEFEASDSVYEALIKLLESKKLIDEDKQARFRRAPANLFYISPDSKNFMDQLRNVTKPGVVPLEYETMLLGIKEKAKDDEEVQKQIDQFIDSRRDVEKNWVQIFRGEELSREIRNASPHMRRELLKREYIKTYEKFGVSMTHTPIENILPEKKRKEEIPQAP